MKKQRTVKPPSRDTAKVIEAMVELMKQRPDSTWHPSLFSTMRGLRANVAPAVRYLKQYGLIVIAYRNADGQPVYKASAAFLNALNRGNPKVDIKPAPKKLKTRAKELQRGIRHEMEHTRSKKAARLIAEHHLAEHPDYYSKLEKCERRMKKNPGDTAFVSALKRYAKALSDYDKDSVGDDFRIPYRGPERAKAFAEYKKAGMTENGARSAVRCAIAAGVPLHIIVDVVGDWIYEDPTLSNPKKTWRKVPGGIVYQPRRMQ